MKRILLFAALGLVSILLAQNASAHESRPLYIELVQQAGDRLSLTWRTPASVEQNNLPAVTLTTCEPTSPAGTVHGPGGPVSQQLYRCPEGLSDVTLDILYPRFNPSVASLVQVKWASGETRSVLSGPDETSIALPDQETTAGVATEYFILGVEHIWTGYDHLLFVACLVLIAGTWRRMLVTVTGFTIAHSITLALAALQLVRVPVPPVEATIALSIVFLAVEIVRDRRDTLTWHHPIAVSASFGLLHGFGFASVLTEIGLPQTEIPAALLFFNIGVEAGQVAFVAVLVTAFLLAKAGMRHIGSALPAIWEDARAVQRVTGYCVGVTASFWMIERVMGFAT